MVYPSMQTLLLLANTVDSYTGKITFTTVTSSPISCDVGKLKTLTHQPVFVKLPSASTDNHCIFFLLQLGAAASNAGLCRPTFCDLLITPSSHLLGAYNSSFIYLFIILEETETNCVLYLFLQIQHRIFGQDGHTKHFCLH